MKRAVTVIPGVTSHAAGALAVIRYAKIHGTKHRPWLRALLARRPTKVAAIALANKITRMAWAIMAKGERYKNPSHSRHKQDRARCQLACGALMLHRRASPIA